MVTHLIQANVLNGIPIPDRSVHMVVTSPPYYGLRDYGVEDQIGLEPMHDCLKWATREEPIKHCCHICNVRIWAKEVWRVLRDDGTFWLNYGDSYNGSGKGGNGGMYGEKGNPKPGMTGLKITSLKPKDLIGIPWRVALALQSDGWYLRSDIIWHKRNPMPESVTDRPSKSHEYIFLLTKSKKYFYDTDAIREKAINAGKQIKMPDGMATHKGGHGSIHKDGREKGRKNNAIQPAGRNKRSVWSISTKHFKGAHFATFPPELPETCIKAGTSEKGVCSECGTPWERITDIWYEPQNGKGYKTETPKVKGRKEGLDAGSVSPQEMKHGTAYRRSKTVGWEPSCEHDHEPVPATVLDLFGGSGTTGQVAQSLGRDCILTDINPIYIELQKERTGIKAMNEWTEGRKAESNREGLPMFGESQEKKLEKNMNDERIVPGNSKHTMHIERQKK